MSLKISWFHFCKKSCFILVVLVCSQIAHAQKLVDYLALATKNFTPQSSAISLSQNGSTTQLEFGYFVEPQYTVSGAQKAYVSFMQQIPWLGKSAAYRKTQKHLGLQQVYNIEQQKELLKFKVKEAYYLLYDHKHEKDAYVILSDKLRKHIDLIEKDTLVTSAKALLKAFERKQQLVELTKKIQLVDGEYQNTLLKFNTLLKQDSFQEVELPLELAMPTEDQPMSFTDAYENPLFNAYEQQLLALRQAQKYSNKWLPTLSLGLRYAQVTSDNNMALQLPVQDIVEPRLLLQWDVFAKREKILSKESIETQIEQKVLDVTSLLQAAMNDQISARISHFAALDKLDQLAKLKMELLEKNVSLSSDELFQLEYLETIYEVEKVKAVTDYYISSSKMLLYQ